MRFFQDISRTDFERLGMIVRDHCDLPEYDLRRKVISIFRHEVTDSHFRVMYYHIGVNDAAREVHRDLKHNLLCLREN